MTALAKNIISCPVYLIFSDPLDQAAFALVFTIHFDGFNQERNP